MESTEIHPCPLLKCFRTEIIQGGQGLKTPNEGTVCKAIIEVDEEYSNYFNLISYEINRETNFCVGEGIGTLSEIVDLVLQDMKKGAVHVVYVNLEAIKNIIDLKTDSSTVTTLQIRITLHQFERQKDVFEMTPTERINHAERLKILGTECFRKTDFRLAEKFYIRALKYTITVGREQRESTLEIEDFHKYSIVKSLCLLNLAACHLKEKRYEDVIKQCSKALDLDGTLTKGYFRRGQAHMNLNEFELAKEDFNKGLELEPDNRPIQEQMKILDGKIKKLERGYAKAMSKFFESS